MKLYGFWKSSATWRVRIALAYKALEHEYQPVDLLTGEGEQYEASYAQVNPLRQVPVLQVQNQAGETVRLGQSMAILEYLEEMHPEPALLPKDPWARARARQIAEMVNAGIQPLQNHTVTLALQDQHGVDRAAWLDRWVMRGLRAIEAVVADTAGRYAVGDALSLADVLIVPQIGFAKLNQLDVSSLARLLEIEARCAQMDCFQRAHPSAQPDAP